MALKMISEITEIKSVHLFIRIIIGLLGYCMFASGFFVDYAENSELIQQRIGYNITLQCNLSGVINKSKANSLNYYWYFKQCGENSGSITNCYNRNDNEDWTQLPCEDNFCQSELKLKNVTEKYSGLYKCTVIPNMGSTAVDIKLVRTFQLDIKNTSHKIPEFLEAYPLNKSVSLGSQAVFQCRVFSEEYPTFKWFRRLPDYKNDKSENLHSIVYYNGRKYELLTGAREKTERRDVYLSKLILNEVRQQDEGFYACVTISVQGHNIREAYLQIHKSEDESTEYWGDYGEESVDRTQTEPEKFWIYFLMPLGLAILPLSVWLCYVIYKRCQHNAVKDASNYSEDRLATDQQRML